MHIKQERAISPLSFIALLVGVIIIFFFPKKEGQKTENPVEIIELAESFELPVSAEPFQMAKPLESLNVTAGFGLRGGKVHPRGHFGTDFFCQEGEPIYAGFEGIITFAGLNSSTAQNPQQGYGYQVKLSVVSEDSVWEADHNHLAGMPVVEYGQIVQTGEVLGYCGSTGNSTGPHLHLTLKKDEERVNPMDFIFQ